MNAINSIAARIAEFVFWPLAERPFWDLFVWSAVLGLLFTVAFRYVSPQKRLAVIRDRISGNMLAISVFQDDLVTTLQCAAKIGGYVVLRLLYWIPAMLALALPMVLVLGQFFVRYQYRPLGLGESAVVEIEFAANAWKRHSNASFASGPNLAIDTAAVRDPERRTVAWRIRAVALGDTDVRLKLGDVELAHQIAVSENPTRLVPVAARRPGPDIGDRLIHPSHQAFASSSSVRSIQVHYPERSTPFWNWDIPWWLTLTLVYLIVAMAAGWKWDVVF